MSVFNSCRRTFAPTLMTLGLMAATSTTWAADAGKNFQHIATFDVTSNGTEVAEIVDATVNGKGLVYTDSEIEVLGFVDISDPANPLPAGIIELGGEPTSVAVQGPRYALVGVNTSPGDEEDEPAVRSGYLAIVDLKTHEIVREIELEGQPDSIAISPDRLYAAIVVENERNEDYNDGLLPQDPPGKLVVLQMNGSVASWQATDVDLTGIADVAPSDPEPEFADVNGRNEAVVSMQENNHFVIVDLVTAQVINDFPAGSVTIHNIDNTEEELGPQETGLIIFDESITRRREPDTVAWVDDDHFASANEGDYEDESAEEGGSRGFTVFNSHTGAEVFESYATFEMAAASAGHYNEGRSENKGGEPEAAEYGKFGPDHLLFIGSERANILGVYDWDGESAELLQLLPTGSGPEGVKAITSKQLLAVAAENSEEGAFPSMITIYQQQEMAPAYPQIQSVDEAPGVALPWVAQSGLAADLDDASTLYSVSDSFLAQSYFYTIDASVTPALITARTPVGDPDGAYDLEGIAAAPEGGFWLASEGRNGARPNLIVKVDQNGAIEDQFELPAGLVAGATNSGFEGVAVSGESESEYVYVVVQREWADDPSGEVKIGRFEVATQEWTFVRYPLEDPSPAGGWVGLSEITLLPDGTFAIIERDNQLGPNATVKRLYQVELEGADFREWDDGDGLVTIGKTLIRDLLGVMEANSIWTPDKLEGFAIAVDGETYASTDNDGLDDALGQSLFLRLGEMD